MPYHAGGTGELKLILCSGPTRREGWKTLDANPANAADYVAFVPPLPSEVMLKKWEEIELIHGITSFYPWEAETLLREIKQALAPGGKLVLEQPDFRLCAESVEWLFGDPSPREPLHLNRWAYSPNSLETLLRQVGFEHCRQMEAQHHMPSRDFRIEAW